MSLKKYTWITLLPLLLALETSSAFPADEPHTTATETAPAAESTPATDIAHYPGDEKVWLMRDFWQLQNTLPHAYRTMQSPFVTTTTDMPTRKGMDELHASGSGEFSRTNLNLLKERLPKDFKLMVVDLRQESHGFLNGLGVSWFRGRNQINWGKTREQIREDETERLQSLSQLKEVTTFDFVKTDSADGLESGGIPIESKVDTVQSEEELCRSMGVEYVRMPVADDHAPTHEEIDRFVKLVEHLDKHTWLHIHCAVGNGRTTTFLTFFDMMHNAHHVSFDDIIKRQWLIGGFELMTGTSSKPWKMPFVIERRKTIRDFYDFWQQRKL